MENLLPEEKEVKMPAPNWQFGASGVWLV